MKVKIINKSDNPMPTYKTEGSAGMDIRANLPNAEISVYVLPNSTLKIPTGISIELPDGYEAQIRPRSGLSAKGIDVKLGTIDSDYRGEISVILHNTTDTPFKIMKGDRIAQMVIAKYEKIEWEQVETLSDTERGIGGFGHTGIK
jgi:dUTP pyrophosphatase